MRLASLLSLCTFFAIGAVSAAGPTREEVLATAAAYANHRWMPAERNRLHAPDAAGIPVRTPDRSVGNPGLWEPGTESIGMPYKWGGFDTLASFDRGIRTGKAAGDLYSAEKRRKGGAAVSGSAVGVDCSGFISRCWQLREKYSTSTLPKICRRLGSVQELRPGDVLNQPGGHVVLFVEWLDDSHTAARFYEAEPFSKVILSQRNVPSLLAAGYSPLRYRDLLEK